MQFDLADGIYTDLTYFGTEIQYKLTDSLRLEGRNRYSDGFRSIDYIFNGVAATWQAIANAAASRDATQFAAGLSGGNYAFQLVAPGQGNAVIAASAAAAAALGNGLGNRKSWQHSDGPVSNFQQDLRVVGSFNDDKTTDAVGPAQRMALTGHFLEHHVFAHRPKGVPAARRRLADRLAEQG